MLGLFTLFACAFLSLADARINLRPIIGVLAEPPTDGPGVPPEKSHFPAEYVRWLSAAGARVAVLRYDMDEATLKFLFDSVNGILFTGGEDSLLPSTQYFQTAQKLYSWAVEANSRGDFFPLWGTCQGFQLLSVLAAEDQSILLHNHFDSTNYSIPIVPTEKAKSSRLFNGLRPETIVTLTTKNATQNLHHDGVLPTSYTTNAKLAAVFDLLSVNTDRKGVPFGSTMEGKKLPFYATQWHPERNQFDWGLQEDLDKSPDALLAMQDLANFYVSETRKNFHAFPTPAQERDNLIFKWNPTYTGNQDPYPEEETYYFPLWKDEKAGLN
eukprot:TRINITY_DN4025_c0_g1_i1.p1 TRINITY_DN4025_c0_g1~~TRINITY_DN4025_c0_g1_i1.p1  ORF type:complete len:326 (-),score=72.71 TRINITY_DN4025_c0_g1_i1:71-1048(-)